MDALPQDRNKALAAEYAGDLESLRALRRNYEALVPVPLQAYALATPRPIVRTATALFTDLRGFTALGERFAGDPARLLAIVNDHLTVVVRAILVCGGVVEKFVGDGVFATFGVHVHLADHRERALAAALAAVGANEGLNRRNSVAGRGRLEVGVGAAAGDVVVGIIGPPERRELGVLGDPVNVAARLVSRAAAGEVLLAASVYRALAGQVRAELVGRSALRGRVGKVDVYRIKLLGQRTRRTDSTASI